MLIPRNTRPSGFDTLPRPASDFLKSPRCSLGLTSVADAIGIRNALFVSAASYLCVAILVLLGPGRHIHEVPATGVGVTPREITPPA